MNFRESETIELNMKKIIIIIVVALLVSAGVLTAVFCILSRKEENPTSDISNTGAPIVGGINGNDDSNNPGERISEYAKSFVGVTPYVDETERDRNASLQFGANNGEFVHLVYREFGIHLPQSSLMYQYDVDTAISVEELAPGDIVVYRYGASIGIYIGEEKVVICLPDDGATIRDLDRSLLTRCIRVFRRF